MRTFAGTVKRRGSSELFSRWSWTPVRWLLVAVLVWHTHAFCAGSAKAEWPGRYEVRIPLDIRRETQGTLSRFPLTVPVGFLDLPGNTNASTACVFDPNGKRLPTQVDDLDGDGRIGGRDELVFLADLTGTDTRCYLHFDTSKAEFSPRAPAAGAVPGGFDPEGRPHFDNGQVRLRDEKFACRFEDGKDPVDLLSGDGTFTFDVYDFGGSRLKPWQTRIAAAGPVRTVLRRWAVVAPANPGKDASRVPAQVIHEWHVYSGRRECFVKSRVENLARDKRTLKVARGWAWLDVTPGGRYSQDDLWTAVAAPWKTWTRSMTGGRKTQRARDGFLRDLRPAEGWFDAYMENPTSSPGANIGLVFGSAGESIRLWAGEYRGRFRVVVIVDKNWPRVPPQGALEAGFWIVPHTGGPEEVRTFWDATRKVHVIPGEIERKPGRK